MADPLRFPHEPLTAREQEILELIAGGLTNQQIAERLYLTLDTVKWYNRQIYQKLGVHSRTQAIASIRELDLPDEPPPAAKHTLPIQDTVFIGREQELATIQERLADPSCRLLTLLGPGGIGKTRLAIEAARRQLARYPDGVYFVPLAPVQSPEFVVQALADGIGLTLANHRDALEQVAEYLHKKRLLLLIDSFEHLLEAAYLLGDVLARSSTVKLLVTSRERLRLKEEWVFDVQGLRYPVEERLGQEGTRLSDYEAGQLFLWTAQRARADFIPDEEDQAHMARICRLVGGMPLAVELAASWVRLLPCAEIAAGIAHDLDMLTAVWRNVPERHRSIQAVLDHSWKLLEPEEQEAFRRLAVFAGNFGREAAAAVAGTSLTMLLSLVDKSFLRRIDPDQFNIHELVKQYGSEKLKADPEVWRATQLRHCRYYAAFLGKRMNAPDAGQYLGEIERLFDDVQMAWRFAVQNRLLAEIQQLAAGFQVYYQLHSWYRAGSGAVALYHQALACFEPDTSHPGHQATLAVLYESLGDLEELATAHADALAAYDKALAYTASNDHVRRGRNYGKIAEIWMIRHRHEAAHQYYTLAESALEKASQRDAAWWGEWFGIKTKRMELYYWQNRPEEIVELARRIHPLIEQHGTVTQRIHFLDMLGMAALRRDRYLNSSDAITHSRQALALSLETGDLGEIADKHFQHGFNLLWSDQLDEAEAALQIALEMTEQGGHLVLLARVVTYLAVLYRKREDIERVREYAGYGLRVARQAKMPQYSGMAQAQMAWLAWRTGDLAEAKRLAEAAIEDWNRLEGAQAVVMFRWLALFPLMDMALQEGEIEQAVHWSRELLTPTQQRLPDDLTSLLERAIAGWEDGHRDTAAHWLHQSLRCSQALHYL